MSGHLAVGVLLFALSIAIMLVYVAASIVPSILAAPFGITAEKLQFTLVFVPVALAMIGVSIGVAYVGYSIVKESQERKGPEKEEKG
ncbi:MAG: hypothetical protein JTT11_00885 [Candidatus Brockarchaeota archaeon]|nr:hypothetical protein [Candidatus Brockarchaeota archaeon]